MFDLDGDLFDLLVLTVVLTSFSYWYTKVKSRNAGWNVRSGPSKFKHSVCKIQFICSAVLLGFRGISHLNICLSYPTCKTHAPCYISIFDLSGCIICFHIISQTARSSGEKYIEHKMCVSIFSTAFVWNISYSKKNSAKYYHKCTSVFL